MSYSEAMAKHYQDKASKESGNYINNIKEPKFNVDFSNVVFEMGVIMRMGWEPKTGYALFREFKDIKGTPYHVWKDSDEYYLVNMTNGNTLKHFDNEKELINYYFGKYDPSKPEG